MENPPEIRIKKTRNLHETVNSRLGTSSTNFDIDYVLITNIFVICVDKSLIKANISLSSL